MNHKAIRPMSRYMRDRLNYIIRYSLAKSDEITDLHIDQGMTNTSCGDRFIFASYTAWGVLCIQNAFLDRMASPELGDSKTLIKRDIQTNPHLHPKLKEYLFKILRRRHVRFNWLRHIDSAYCERIRGGKESIQLVMNDITNDTNLPPKYKDNLLLNCVNYQE